MAHFKAFLYELLVNVVTSLLLDVFNLVKSTSACLAVLAPSLCGLT